MESSVQTIEKLKKAVDFPFIELHSGYSRDELKKILIESFKALSKAEEDLKNGKYDHRVFICHEKLKRSLERHFIQTIPKPERMNYVFLSAITKYKSSCKKEFLVGLAKRGTFTIWNKQMHANYCYPFRDFRSPEVTQHFLEAHGFGETQHSGCRICPILLLFNLRKEDPARWTQSKRFLLIHVKKKFCRQPGFQMDTLDF